jgi:hypothetical protein
MTEPESGCSIETPARTPLHQTTRALRLSALLRIQRSTSWRGITGPENSSIAPFRDRFRTRQSMVADRPSNTIRPARYVRRLSLLRCSFNLRSLFGTARGFYPWFSNGRANLSVNDPPYSFSGAVFWATSPHRRFCMQSWPQAARLLLFAVPCYGCPVTSHYTCSLPAQFPMKSVATAATDGLGPGSCKTGDSRKGSSATVRCARGRRRTSCAIGATVAGAVLR